MVLLSALLNNYRGDNGTVRRWGLGIPAKLATSSTKNVKHLLWTGAGTGQYDLTLSLHSKKEYYSGLGSFLRPYMASNPNLYVVCRTGTVVQWAREPHYVKMTKEILSGGSVDVNTRNDRNHFNTILWQRQPSKISTICAAGFYNNHGRTSEHHTIFHNFESLREKCQVNEYQH